MYALIQYPQVNSNYMQVVKLDPMSKVSPSGYIIGGYKVVFPKLTITASHRIIKLLNK